MDRERIISLQILRFFAAMAVVTLHVRNLVPMVAGASGSGVAFNALESGAAGVDVFFVLSGLVIALTGPLAKPQPSGAVFFWRRWRRVAPLYFLLTIPVLVAAIRSGGLDPGRVAATFLFWPYAAARPAYPYLEPGWTLCFEMAFYASVALALALAKSRRAVICAALAVGALSIFNGLFLEFGFGLAMASNRDRIMRLGAPLGVLLIFASLAVIILEASFHLTPIDESYALLGGRGTLRHVIAVGLPSACIVAGTLALEPWAKGRLASLLSAGGDASFAIYLTNQTGANAAVSLLRFLPSWSWAATAASFCLGMPLLFGLVIHRWIERPILRDLKRLRLLARPVAAAD
ncbi:MAG TPA: acyltransferase [Caulobacteraceae bacterium]|jgi:exopolysaccharide production protein ExoZ|nr:acyltransferase [Caulobacteraceae bacterium]